VRLVAPVRGGSAETAAGALAAERVRPRLVTSRPRMPRVEGLKIAAAAAAREPYVLFARHRSAGVARAVRDEARRQRPDVLYLDHLDSLVYADTVPGVPMVTDLHNVYSRLADRAADEVSGPVRRRYLAGEARLLARRELTAARRTHTIMAVSDDDAAYFSALGAARTVVVPNGVDCSAYAGATVARPGPPTLLYVGALDWPPNATAARLLATEVLAAVRQRVPEARVTIVGKNPPAEVLALAHSHPNVEVAGNVRDVVPYFRSAHVLAVPLEAGGGTRLKILEAFAAGLPVVSTPVGCEGIDGVHEEHLLVADRSHFADAIVRSLVDPAAAGGRARRALRLAAQQYDWSAVGRRAVDAVSRAAAGTSSMAGTLQELAVQTEMPTR